MKGVKNCNDSALPSPLFFTKEFAVYQCTTLEVLLEACLLSSDTLAQQPKASWLHLRRYCYHLSFDQGSHTYWHHQQRWLGSAASSSRTSSSSSSESMRMMILGGPRTLQLMSHLDLRPNRMLIVCVPRNQVYTHTVQKINT
jgi:hypothetical protein